MDDDRQNTDAYVQLTDAQIQVLRKHLERRSMSLDDAAVLVGVPVEDLAQHFQGRRASQNKDDRAQDGSRRRSRASAYDPDERDLDGDGETGLRAPARSRSRRRDAAGSGSRSWLWAGGTLAAIAVAGALALMSGLPQSLLFPPRGVGDHKDANAADPATPVPLQEVPPTEAPLETAQAEAPATATVDPLTAPAAPEAVADPAMDPSAALPETAEPPVPAAPEEVAPAVAVAEAETPAEPIPAAPSFDAPTAAAPAPIGPSATLYAARAASVRDNPTANGSVVVAQLKRGESVSGAIVAGADGKSSWLHIERGPGAGGYVSVANMSDGPRPAVVQAIGQARNLVQAAALHAAPDESSPAIDTLSPGITVMVAAEVEGGWIEINRRAGGVGYVRREAFE